MILNHQDLASKKKEAGKVFKLTGLFKYLFVFLQRQDVNYTQ